MEDWKIGILEYCVKGTPSKEDCAVSTHLAECWIKILIIEHIISFHSSFPSFQFSSRKLSGFHQIHIHFPDVQKISVHKNNKNHLSWNGLSTI